VDAAVGRAGEEVDVARGGIDAGTLKGMLDRGEKVAVVDVRKAEEHERGSVPGAVSFDAYDALNAGDERAMEGLELLEGARVVTVCNRGRAAAAAAEQLRGQGPDAVHLEGGMDAWRAP
jgi:rhodanese-related sulfurtransferase